MKLTLFFVAIFASVLFVTSSPVEGDKLVPSVDGSFRIGTFDNEGPSIVDAGLHMPTTSRGLKSKIKKLINQAIRCLRVIIVSQAGHKPTDRDCKVGLKKCKKQKKICKYARFLLRKLCKKGKKVCKAIKKRCK